MRTFSSVGTVASSSRHRSSVGRRGAVDVGRAREPVPLVGLAELRVVARLAQRLVDDVGVERAGPRVALAVVGDRPARRRPRPRGRQRLDLAAEHLDLGLARAHDVGLDLLAGACRPRATPRAMSSRSLDSRRGAADGHLPHQHRRLARRDRARSGRSCRTCRSRCRSRCRPRRSSRSTSGPLPMSCAARTGRVISPCSMRYASVTPNTKSPVAGFTWPPPSCTQ